MRSAEGAVITAEARGKVVFGRRICIGWWSESNDPSAGRLEAPLRLMTPNLCPHVFLLFGAKRGFSYTCDKY